MFVFTFHVSANTIVLASDTSSTDTTLSFPFSNSQSGGLFMNNPSNFSIKSEYDIESNQYLRYNLIGNQEFGTPEVMSFEEYQKYDMQDIIKDYWKIKTKERKGVSKSILGLPKLYVPGQAFDRIFGGNTVDIRPQGTAELIFGVKVNRLDNPSLPEEQRKTVAFDFQEKIQMNVVGKIGDKLKVTTSFNTETTFDFENHMKIEYTGYEDEIIKKIEVGNVSLPLNGTLITGNQSLFGIKTKLQFGRMTVTGILTQQKSTTSEVEVQGGAQKTEFDIYADQYEENKHFFLSHYFKQQYDTSLSKLPFINSPINITKIEVWITNKTGVTDDTRNIIAFLDLAENNNPDYPEDNNIFNTYFVEKGCLQCTTPNNGSPPDYQDASNSLYKYLVTGEGGVNNSSLLTTELDNLRDINQATTVLAQFALSPNLFFNGQDYEKLERARKLKESEFTLHPQLGYISLNQALNNDEVLAVAFQYTINSQTHQVGELSSTGPPSPQTLFVKLLKGTSFSPKLPNWDLMMKNIYSLGAYQMSSNNFILDVVYENTEESGALTNYLPETDPSLYITGKPIIRLLGVDRLNQQMAVQQDGVFDFVEGITVKSANGRVIFPVREPFGSHLKKKFQGNQLADKYVYQQLYDSTITIARQFPEYNKFRLKGSYEGSAGAEIRLNAMNVPEGSVTVTAGAQKLVENQDYTVDYMLGRVTIINQGILNSGLPIKVSLENNSMFGIQNKTLLGIHADYKINDGFILGATMLNLTERPITPKINAGDEPISNTIWGMDATFESEVPWLTKAVDKLPFIETKAKSRFIATAEFAHLIPGHHKAIGKSGVSYIDDFESSKTTIDLKNIGTWQISSIPQHKPTIEFPAFEYWNSSNIPEIGYKRAKIAWYTIDPLFFRSSSLTPPNINMSISLPDGSSIPQKSYHYSREIAETEVFPNKDPDLGSQITNLSVLDIAYYPKERGPYNYRTGDIDSDGNLQEPKNNWGGIMRKLETNDFEAANIEFIEFWMMDPFNSEDGNPYHTGGNMYIHLGNVSEDILKDGYKSFENGLPTSAVIENVDTSSSVWGYIPTNLSIVDAFDNDPTSRRYQDVGLDGLNNDNERIFFNDYLQEIQSVSSIAYQRAFEDPSTDDFHYFRGTDFDNSQEDILSRYKNYNNLEGNSVTTDQSPESYPTAATNTPNSEDINQDNTLSEIEGYFEYKLRLQPGPASNNFEMKVGENYISDILRTKVKTENGQLRDIIWYQFRVPVYQPNEDWGTIQDFKSIRFMRMILSDFEEPIICRFASLELVRGEWRRYNFDLSTPGEYIPIDDNDETLFDVSAVNIEENGNRSPIPYVLPPGIDQEVDNTTTAQRQENEQSLVLKVCNLKDGDSRAAYKASNLDVRSYKRLKMFVHAEGDPAGDILKQGDLSCFIRLGTDFISNYYEYEIELTPTSFNAISAEEIWPASNEIDIPFEIFQLAKQERNNNSFSTNTPFIQYTAGGKVVVVGNPNLSQVKTIMIGVRNPKKLSIDSDDDGLSKCGQIWVNELRLTDFDEYGGWAANTRMTARLADFGNITLAGSLSTIGFGSIEKKVNERQKYNAYQYDISSSLDLGKFFPEKLGVRVPMYVGVSESIKNPQYNPLDPDILFSTSLQALNTNAEKDSLKHIAQDYVKRTSINFTNIRKTRVPKKGESQTNPKIYDIENFTLSYSKNETFIRNINTEYNRTVDYRGSITYNFNTQPKNIKPFYKLNFGKSPYLKLIKEFNFYSMPKSFSFRSDLDRSYSEMKSRNLNNVNMIIEPTYNKFFHWNRMYEVKYDLMRSLKLDFSVNVRANIDEPAGKIDRDDPFYKQKIDTIWNNFLQFGRITSYNQNFGVNYQAPLSKIPILNFLSFSSRYNASYDWTGAPLALENLGNTIQNSNNNQYNGQINLTTLYNKVPYFRKLTQKKKKRSSQVRNNDENDKEKVKDRYSFFKHLARFLLSTKNISVNYSVNRGIFLPGFRYDPHFLGQEWGKMAPGLPFTFGSQKDIRGQAGQEDWLVKDPTLNTLYKRNSSNNTTLRATLQPINHLRIELNASKINSINSQEYFRWDDSTNIFRSFSPTSSGSYSISFLSINTAFNDELPNYSSKAFNNFRNYRYVIAEKLAYQNSNFRVEPNSNGSWVETFSDPETGFPIEYTYTINGTDPTTGEPIIDSVATGGYGPTSQEVMIPAFLAAYGISDQYNVGLTSMPPIPFPNWRVTYDGLSKISFIKKIFKTVTLGHAYRSTYSIGSYASNLNYTSDDAFNLNNMSYHVENEISQVTINEQFSPLLKIDIVWKNGITNRFEIKKSRVLALSLGNNQLTETDGSDYVFGAGYRIRDVQFRLFSLGKQKKMTSDLEFKLDLSIRNNKTIIRQVIENVEQITMGQQIVTLKTSVDYVFNQRLNIKAFFDKVITNPFISTTYPGAITNAGISLRFTLAG